MTCYLDPPVALIKLGWSLNDLKLAITSTFWQIQIFFTCITRFWQICERLFTSTSAKLSPILNNSPLAPQFDIFLYDFKRTLKAGFLQKKVLSALLIHLFIEMTFHLHNHYYKIFRGFRTVLQLHFWIKFFERLQTKQISSDVLLSLLKSQKKMLFTYTLTVLYRHNFYHSLSSKVTLEINFNIYFRC